MGRPRLNDGMNEFFAWLVHNDYSPSTAKSYTSSARRATRALGDRGADQAAVDAYFEELFTEQPVTYPNVLRAWKLVVEWEREENGKTLVVPRPLKKMKRRSDAAPTLEPETRAALRILREHGITPRHILQLRWCDVEIAEIEGAGRTHVKVPGKVEEWLVPSASMKVLWDRAQANADLSVALLPRDPGGHQSYPYKRLRSEIEIYTEEEIKKKVAGPVGSALGGHLPRGAPSSLPVEECDDEFVPTRTTADTLKELMAYDPDSLD